MKKKQNLLFLILLVITIAAVCVAMWAVFFRDNSGQELTPNVAPKEEQYAETIPGDNNEKMEEPEGGSSVSISYGREVAVDLSDKMVALIFANPGKSNQDMVLQVLIQDTVIAQSGTIKPGNQITAVELLDDMVDNLPEGTYDGVFNVLFYDLESGEKAIVNANIPIVITVSE